MVRLLDWIEYWRARRRRQKELHQLRVDWLRLVMALVTLTAMVIMTWWVVLSGPRP